MWDIKSQETRTQETELDGEGGNRAENLKQREQIIDWAREPEGNSTRCPEPLNRLSPLSCSLILEESEKNSWGWGIYQRTQAQKKLQQAKKRWIHKWFSERGAEGGVWLTATPGTVESPPMVSSSLHTEGCGGNERTKVKLAGEEISAITQNQTV
jgi:hypothetical protein